MDWHHDIRAVSAQVFSTSSGVLQLSKKKMLVCELVSVTAPRREYVRARMVPYDSVH